MKKCTKCNSCFSSTEWICPICNYEIEETNGVVCFSPELAFENSGFSPSYYKQLAEVEKSSFWFRARNSLILWAIRKHLPNAKTFLEIGCGTGCVLSAVQKMIPELEVHGSEIYLDGLSYIANSIKKTNLYQMDARKIPFYKEFDIIGAFDVLEHIEEDELALSQIYGAVKNGGGIIITVPQHQVLWSKADEHAFHVRRYEADDLKRKIKKAGFEIIDTFSFVSLLFPLMLLTRVKKRKSLEKYNPKFELSPGVLINSILYVVLAFEKLLIRFGIRFPFGGSLCVIAKKE